MTTSILADRITKPIKSGNQAVVYIPKDWGEITGIELGKEIIIGLAEGKHGKFLAVWNPSKQKEPKKEL